MADLRPKDLSSTATYVADDDYLTLDGAAAGTQKMLADKFAEQMSGVQSSQFIDAALKPAVFTTRDSGVSTSAELQAFADYCRTNARHGIIRAGYYKLETSVWLTSTAYHGVKISGEGSGYSVSSGVGSARAQTILDVSSIVDAPGLIIQNARGVWLSNLAIVGANVAPADLTKPSPNVADYLTDGVSNTRYSPQCAIAIDPTCGDDPGSEQGYADLGAYTGAQTGSAFLYFDGLNLRQHAVGIMVSPSYNGVQGDMVLIDRTHIQHCAVGVALGQSQTRGAFLRGVSFNRVHVCADTTTYGQHQGALQSIAGCQVVNCYAMLDIATNFQTFCARDVYAETLATIGRVGYGASGKRKPATFENIEVHVGYSDSWLPAPILLEASGPVQFRGSYLQNYGNDIQPINIGSNGSTVLISNSCVANLNSTMDRLVFGVQRDYTSQSKVSVELVDVEREVGIERLYSDRQPRRYTLPSRILATYGTREVVGKDAVYAYIAGRDNTYFNSAISSISVDDEAGTVAFTASSAADFIVGDLIFWLVDTFAGGSYNVPSLMVSSKDGSTVTCAMLFDPSLYDTEYAPTNAAIYVEEWAPGEALTGDMNNSTSLTNVSPTTIVRNGDFIKGDGIPDNARVVSGAGTSTLVLNKTTTGGSATGVDLYFGRLHTYTTNAAF